MCSNEEFVAVTVMKCTGIDKCVFSHQEEHPCRYEHDDCCCAGVELQLWRAETRELHQFLTTHKQIQTIKKCVPKSVRITAQQLLGENILQAADKKRRVSQSTTPATGVWCSCSTNQSMMLVDRAAEKPSMLKLISVAVQRARPTMTGNRDRFTHRPAGWKINS